MQPIAGDGLPEPKRDYTRLVWAQPGRAVDLISFSSTLYGQQMHWTEARTDLCRVRLGQCDLCAACWPKIWYGWLVGHSPTFGCRAILQVPMECVRATPRLMDSSTSLRGCRIRLQRIGGDRRSRVSAQVFTGNRSFPDNFQEPDVLSELVKMYDQFALKLSARKGQQS